MYQIRYRLKGYQISDSFQLDPNYGFKSYRIDTELIGCEDPVELRKAAIAEPPNDRFSLRGLPYSDSNPIIYIDTKIQKSP